jgi:hypothetical protein
VSVGIHLSVKDADDLDARWSDSVIDCVAIEKKHAVSLSDVVARCSYIRIACQRANPLIEFVEISIGLIRAPLFKGIEPNVDQITLGTLMLVDLSSQELRFTRRRAFRLISFISSSPASPLFSP